MKSVFDNLFYITIKIKNENKIPQPFAVPKTLRTFVALTLLKHIHTDMLEEIRQIPKEQVIMAFVATCIETTARQTGVDYTEIFQRMERVGMIDNYILPNYETLHSESREVLAERLMECLKNWEDRE